MPLFGCLTSSALEVYTAKPSGIFDSYSSGAHAAAFFAGVGLAVCQLAVNMIDNSFSAGADLSSLFPKYTSIRRGAYIGLSISIAMCPWDLLSSVGTFIIVISAYSIFLGPYAVFRYVTFGSYVTVILSYPTSTVYQMLGS